MSTRQIPARRSQSTAILSLSLLTGCTASTVDDSGPRENIAGTVQQATKKTDCPKCDSSTFATVYYVSDEARFYYCNGKKLLPLDVAGAAGTPGEDGTTWLVALHAASTTTCEAGGTLIQIGPDLDEDGALDAAEISAASAVCNGVEGQAGVDGEDGTNGEDGEDGEDGASGLSSLITQTEVPPGTACAEGGVRIDSGLDDDGNGVLDPEEIEATSYICGGTIADEPAGTGGQGDDLPLGKCLDGSTPRDIVQPAFGDLTISEWM